MTLKSILQQSFTDYEVIVSDNDPDGSASVVIEELKDDRFKYFANEQNLGMKKSFNKSLERSSGQYIVMIADDDPVYPDMLETLVPLIEKYPGYGVYLGGNNWFCTEPGIARLYNLKVGMNSFLAYQPIDTVTCYSPEEFLKGFFSFSIFPNYLWSTALVKRSILVEMGGVPDYDTPFLGDYAYLSVMGSHSGCVVINKALGHQTIHAQNFGRSQNEQIRTAAVNFVDYVSLKISHVKGWPVIEENMKRFVAMWVISHLSFLRSYYAMYKNEESVDIRQFEKEAFSVPFIKKYQFKYWLKKNSPALHNLIVNVKKNLKKG